jgi:hypothetical protein
METSVAAHPSGLFLEFHRTQNPVDRKIWYHVGMFDGTTVTWGRSQFSGAEGSWPSVALSKEGYVIVVHSNKVTKSGSDLYYQVGKIDPYGDQNQSITWLTEFKHWDRGFHSSIAINDNGVIVGVHETGHSSNGLYYRVGHLGNPGGGDYTIQWDSGQWGIQYDDGINPHIAINNLNQVVAVHQVTGESLLHYRRGTVSGGDIAFGPSKRYDNYAAYPAVALLDSGLVLEVHSLGGLIARTGLLSLSNIEEIEWAESNKVVHDTRVMLPAVATDGTYVVATYCAGDFKLGLYASVGKMVEEN